jgi:hypothetical protein
MLIKVAVFVHHRNYQEPVSRSQEAYHPDPASPPGLSWEHCCSDLSPNPGMPLAQCGSAYLPATSTGVQACSLPQTAIKHRGHPSTAYPETCSRSPRKILVLQATAIPLGRCATCIARCLICGQHRTHKWSLKL